MRRVAWNEVTQYYWLGIENQELVNQVSKIDDTSLIEFVSMTAVKMHANEARSSLEY
jgi:hypothetical protein